jgi:hypothetical protein
MARSKPARRVAEADERPIDFRAWQVVAAPTAGERDPLIVTFPEPLDHGLLLRALGVSGADQRFLDGEVKIESHETRWRFTPREPWKAGRYQLVAWRCSRTWRGIASGARLKWIASIGLIDRLNPSAR